MISRLNSLQKTWLNQITGKHLLTFGIVLAILASSLFILLRVTSSSVYADGVSGDSSEPTAYDGIPDKYINSATYYFELGEVQRDKFGDYMAWCRLAGYSEADCEDQFPFYLAAWIEYYAYGSAKDKEPNLNLRDVPVPTPQDNLPPHAPTSSSSIYVPPNTGSGWTPIKIYTSGNPIDPNGRTGANTLVMFFDRVWSGDDGVNVYQYSERAAHIYITHATPGVTYYAMETNSMWDPSPQTYWTLADGARWLNTINGSGAYAVADAKGDVEFTVTGVTPGKYVRGMAGAAAGACSQPALVN